ncbi:PBSX family phage terminase large subunit [Pseudoleptotrichia goodfellowii]|uniref:Phage terminase, large subunit, PBSX family n=1 Tax=Pseudoleptotrichia goodfellowii TaxID=157692 RepID=A0A510J8E6_9FUSO|nr:PBSX family phage terminase large subunit [Pseudoleptotrichia goodfellowii]BBM35444.1 phage terminase, large subunit, PBSX family [Pseudoleptotrichia goodfellowii]DAS17736.1 MAG TPA: terminase large subunit [Caudoviricetes sp.]
MTQIKIKDIIGCNYDKFWNDKHFYRVVKGSRGSKKSKTIAINMIYRIMKYPESNLLVIRRVFNTLRNSCRADLIWAINKLKVNRLWKIPKGEHTLTYLPTGQQILFAGLDDPLKLTSITVANGYLNFVWIEECFQIEKQEMFDTLEESIRGKLPDGLFHQITLSFNPWSEDHWLRKRFYNDTYDRTYIDDLIYAITTDYTMNEFLDEVTIKRFEEMKTKNPNRFKVAGMGEWGIAEGLVYDNWEILEFNALLMLRTNFKLEAVFGLDFGFTNDNTAFVASIVDLENKRLYIFDEFYARGMLNNEIALEIERRGYSKDEIIADSAEQKSIEEIKRLGISRIKAASKGKGSVNQGIQYLQQFDIYVHPKCRNVIMELKNYIWDVDKNGNTLNKPIDSYNHALDALRYSIEKYSVGGMHGIL